MNELKPCPFCGGKAKLKISEYTLNCVAFCEKCNVIMKRNLKGNSKLRAMLTELMTEEWNRRYEEPKREIDFDYEAED